MCPRVLWQVVHKLRLAMDSHKAYPGFQGFRAEGCVMWQVVRKLRRLPWAANEAYLVRCLIGAARARASAAPLAASLGAGLAHYHPSLGVALADAVLEEVPPIRKWAAGGWSALGTRACMLMLA